MRKVMWREVGRDVLDRRADLGLAEISDFAADDRLLLGDARYWVEARPMPTDEIGAVFHYRLELIHPFPNGNGRHGRLMTDLLMSRVLGVERFSWGGEKLSVDSDVRKRYIDALRAVDQSNDYRPLIEFVRS